LVSIWRGTKLLYVKKIGTKLNKNNIGTKMNIKH